MIGAWQKCLALAVAGICATACVQAPVDPPAYKLAWPAKHLLREPDLLPQIKAGDSLYIKLAEQRADSAKDKRQLRALLRYIRLIHKRPRGAPQ
jgi:hypothetical protein